LQKGRVRAVNGVEPAPIESGHVGKTSYSDGVFLSRKLMTIFDSGEEHSNELQDKAVSVKTGAAGGCSGREGPSATMLALSTGKGTSSKEAITSKENQT
jgi:hypothetical protein